MARETVVLVHGTFASPDSLKPEDGLAWYQPGSAFCRDLDARLSALGSPAKCWAHAAQDYYHWSGANLWIDRTWAARNLATYIQGLARGGWRVHVVAHSHGGNVLLEALSQLNTHSPQSINGNYVLLGTPIIDFKESRALVLPFRYTKARLAITCLAVWGALAWFAFVPDGPGFGWLSSGWYWLGIVLFWSATIWLYEHLMAFVRQPFGLDVTLYQLERVLAISSPYDEAFRLLDGMQKSTKNPFKSLDETSYLKHIVSAWRNTWIADAMLQSPQSPDRLGRLCAFLFLALLGLLVAVSGGLLSEDTRWYAQCAILLLLTILPGFYLRGRDMILGAFLIPWRIVATPISLIASLVRKPILDATLDLAWWMIKPAAFGLQGAPYPLSDIEVIQGSEKDRSSLLARYGIRIMHKPLPQEAERKALESRSGLYTLKQLTSALDAMNWTTDELTALIKMVARDTKLVHSAYYVQAETNVIIAKHLGITESERDEHEDLESRYAFVPEGME